MSKTARSYGFKHSTDAIFENASQDTLLKHAVDDTGATLLSTGGIVVKTGKHTGRAAKDKYVVFTPKTENTIDWKNNVNKMTPETFAAIKNEAIEHINKQPKLYWTQRNVGAIAKYALEVELFSSHPSHSLFFDYLMRNDKFAKCELGKYTIFHAPTYTADTAKFGTRSETVIAMDLDNNEIVIIGTLYAGEIKKAVFSAMNYILPDHGVLPMHAGANVDAKTGEVSVFFGLSGTGKTTLSTQEGRPLIGDDEHGIGEAGIFNFEGGCYAKTIKLSQSGEPGIWKATNTKGAILENVVVKNGKPDFDDTSLGENGRSAYPLSFIDDTADGSKGKIPNHMFFLSADAFGVLPPVSKLTPKQAMFYFLSGYTAKVAGTEMGVTEPKATFSTCFGAPFMMRNPTVYAKLLGKYIKEHNINVWLINTGWTGGAYGVGNRFPLKVTRRIIEAIQNGELNNAKFVEEANFGLSVPTEIEGVDGRLLNPEKTWSQDGYQEAAKKLEGMFSDNFAAFHSGNGDLLNGSTSN